MDAAHKLSRKQRRALAALHRPGNPLANLTAAGASVTDLARWMDNDPEFRAFAPTELVYSVLGEGQAQNFRTMTEHVPESILYAQQALDHKEWPAQVRLEAVRFLLACYDQTRTVDELRGIETELIIRTDQ